MRTFLLLSLLLALPSVAGAQSDYMQWPTLQGAGKKRPVFQFTAPAAGAYASLTAKTGQTITCTRASSATYIDGNGVRQTAAANTCRVESSGLIVEGQSTNDLLNSTAPATQTTASLATGSYTGWMEGSGSLAFTAGTAVATGLPCTATSASDCHFSITSAGTVTATVTGTVTFEQLEPMGFRTSGITTAGTVVTRSADTDSFTKPANLTIAGGTYCASVTATTEGNLNVQIALGSNQNFAPRLAARDDATTRASCYSDTGTEAWVTYSSQSVSTKYTLKKQGTALTCYAAGTPGTPATTSTQTAEPTTLYLGAHNGANFLFGHISAAVIWNNATGCVP